MDTLYEFATPELEGQLSKPQLNKKRHRALFAGWQSCSELIEHWSIILFFRELTQWLIFDGRWFFQFFFTYCCFNFGGNFWIFSQEHTDISLALTNLVLLTIILKLFY